MKLTILQDKKQIGKTQSGSKHPISGQFKTMEFNSPQDFESILYALQANECLTVGLYPDKYNYVPNQNTQDLAKPRYITRSKQSAAPGHLLLIDCDFENFHYLKGPQLHTFLSTYLPDIFDGAAYVTTDSSSYYTKGKKAYHQYYFFKHAADFSQLHLLIDKLFKHHNILTYSLASNYSRTYIKTPIDTKLHELQMPVYEFSEHRSKVLGLSYTKEDINITSYSGHIIDAQVLSLPTINTDNAMVNHNRKLGEGNTDRLLKLEEYLKTANSTDIRRDSLLLEESHLPSDLSIVASTPGEKQSLTSTTIVDEIVKLLQNETPPHELYQAIGEPGYASHQTAKLMYSNPYNLGDYRVIDQAHGGTNYQIVFDYDSMDKILSLSTTLQPKKYLGLLTAKNNLTIQEAQVLGQLYQRKGLITPGNVTKALHNNIPEAIYEEELTDISDEDITTGIAAIQKSKMKLETQISMMVDKGVDTEKLFNSANIQIIKDSAYGIGNDDIMLKPGPNHSFGQASRAKMVKFLSPKYPTTHISPYADEVVIDALMQKYTATNKVSDIKYMSSLHGEKLYFGEGRVEITYQQQRPTFENVPTSIKHTIDTMTESTRSEFRDMYMKHSLGQIWGPVSELSYIKKVHPQMKKDFLHLHLPSDAGKSFNMDIANVITPYEKTSLDQFFEQAAKINPINIAKSAFLFHDEVNAFHHQWNGLGAHYPIKQAYASDSILTQIPLKVLASAESVMKKGTKQQFNRLMVLNPDIGSYKDLNIRSQDEAFMMAVTYQTIYEEFTHSYNKYASMPEQKALQMAMTNGNAYGIALSSKDMVITGDYISETVKSYLIQELVELGTDTVVNLESGVPDLLTKYVKVHSVKADTLHISFKKQTFSKFVEFVLKETTSSIESRSMNYEALAMAWEDIGCYKLDKPATKGGRSGFYGYCLDIDLETK